MLCACYRSAGYTQPGLTRLTWERQMQPLCYETPFEMVKIMKIPIGKSYFCAHPEYVLAIELTYPFKHRYFDLVAAK